MANYQSIPRRFRRPTSSINHAYIDTALREKQNTIDTNFGFLQQTVDKVLNQDLIRESDREYLKDKVQGVMNMLDRNDEIDFESKKARFSIQDALSEAAKDPNVLRQIANTKRIRQVQQFQQERAKKGDLNQQNFMYAYAKSGINEYMKGDTDDIGEFRYLEYVDVDAKMDEAARKLKAANPNELVSIQNPLTGKTVSKKVSMITPDEMRNYLRAQLNANDLAQLEIDGAMMYGLNNEVAVSQRDKLIADSNKKYNDKVALLENYRDNANMTQGQIEDINSQIEALGAEKAFFERNLIGRNTAEAIGGQQLLENKADLYSQLYTKNGPESIKYDSDFLKRMRDANAEANAANEDDPTRNISTITTPTMLPEEIDPYQESVNRIDRTLQENSDYLQSQFDSLSEDKKKLVSDTMEQIKNDPEIRALYKGQPLSNEALQLETLNRLGSNFFPPDVAKELRSRISNTQAIQDAVQKTTNEFVKAQTLQEEVYDQIFDEETRLTMVTPQGEVNMQQFLRQNGVTNYDTYKSFINGESDAAKKLRATISLQSMSLTNDLSTDDVIVTPGGVIPASGIGTTSRIDLTDSEYKMMRQAAHDLTGESLDETYTVSKNGNDYTLMLKNNTTNFSQIVNRTNELFQSGRADTPLRILKETFGSDIDRTIRNESSVRSLFESDRYREFAANNMKFLDNTVAGSNSIRILGDIKRQVDPIYQEVLQYVDNVTFDKRLPIDIYKREDGSLLVMQNVQDETAISNEEAEANRKTRTGVIQANDVKKMGRFNEQISLMQNESTFSNLENIDNKVNKMTFIGDNREQVEGLNRLYDRANKGENTFRLLSAHKTARDMIFSPSVDQYMSMDHPIRAQFEDFVRNTHNYNLEFTKGIDSDYQVLIKDVEGNDVGAIPLNRNIPVETFEKAYQGTPQVFLALYSKSRVDKYMQSLLNGRQQ